MQPPARSALLRSPADPAIGGVENPNDLFLSGLPFWVQVACFDPTLNAFGASVSNEAKCTLGERGY